MNPCVLASDDEQLIRRLRAVVGDADEGGFHVVPGVFDRHTADRIIKAFHGGPGVLVLGQDVKLDVALELAVRIDLEHPEIATVLVGGGVPDVLPRAMRAGVRDTLDPEASQAEIREVVDRAAAAATRRSESLAPPGSTPRTARSSPSCPRRAARARRRSRPTLPSASPRWPPSGW